MLIVVLVLIVIATLTLEIVQKIAIELKCEIKLTSQL